MNICDKLVLFLGALMSSSLFAFHHMIPSPWNLIYVVLGCLMMPDARLQPTEGRKRVSRQSFS